MAKYGCLTVRKARRSVRRSSPTDRSLINKHQISDKFSSHSNGESVYSDEFNAHLDSFMGQLAPNRSIFILL